MAQLFYHVMQDNVGNLLFGVSGTMRLAGTGTLATIYGDEALTVPIPNPMTNHPSYGSFKCFLGAGDYDFYMAKAGYSFETLTGVQGGGGMSNQEPNNVSITGGHAQFTSLQADSPTFVVNHTTHRVGIGAGAPTQTLDVLGQVYLRQAVGIGTPPETGTNVLATGGGNISLQGSVGIGTSPNPSYALYIDGANMLIGNTRALGVGLAPTYQLHVQNNAGIPGGAWVNSTSLAALKRDIAPLQDALEVLKALTPRRWRWAEDQTDLEALMPGVQAGFVVEEVQAVKPEWTPPDTEGTPGLAMRGLEAYLVAAVQHILERLEALEARIA